MLRKLKPTKKYRQSLGENAAIKSGAGPHRGPRRQQNRLLAELQEELELREELTGGDNER